jgi:hypothetical protein
MTTPTRALTTPYVPPADITIAPPTFTMGPDEARDCLLVCLDVTTGRLWAEQFRDASRPLSDHRREVYFPGRQLWIGGGNEPWNRYPARLGWSPGQWPAYAGTRADFAANLAAIAPWARVLVDSLEPLPDGGYDWTLRATAAFERIGYLVDYGPRPLTDRTPADDPWHGDQTGELPERHHYGAVTFDEIVDADPNWADPSWAAMTDAQLDEVADGILYPYGKGTLAKFLGTTAEERLKATIVFSKSRDDRPLAEQNRGVPLKPVGVRAGLRRWRAARIAENTGLPVRPAAEHLGDQLPDALVATTTDRELGDMARMIAVTAAAEAGVALVGTVDHLARARADMRTRVRFELATIREERAAVAAYLAQLTARRASLLAAVAAFKETPEWPTPDAVEPSYAELGRIGGMTRQAAREQIQPLYAGDDADAAAETRGDARREIFRALEGEPYGMYEDALRRVVERAGLTLSRETVAALLVDMVDERVLERREGSAGTRYALRPAK